ncbi:Phosphatidylinositol transfer protein SFH5 [Candida viswanathii]|uniref:Phosphatidylinositol transfer protein SFH5 n=1 Tax=Candida viswanathii TaxID=5486 RepID=A0A367YF33_9ASCO|nr:Phosphatidylinositol transfer protein SFH5 [Candida viswanathii]
MTNDVASTIKTTDLTTAQAASLSTLIASLPDILSRTDNPAYDEIYGYRMNVDTEPHVDVGVRNEILVKFLAADGYDVDLAGERLRRTLNWRNEFRPLSAGFAETFPGELNDLGSITKFGDMRNNLRVTTWNLYGNMKNPKVIFDKYGGEEEEEDGGLPGNPFLRWRIGMMEQALQLLDFTDPEFNRIAQVQDTNNVSMFSIDPGMKKGMKDIILIFGDNYPELLSVKFFINVPYIMGWMFTFLKAIGVINEETLKKFQVLNHGKLTEFYPEESLPKVYGGKTDVTIFDIDISKEIKLREYGQIMLKKQADKLIEASNHEVE